MEIGLLVLRLVLGLTLAAHGAQKLFGWFGGGGVRGTTQGFEALGFVPGKRAAVLAGLAEGAGGLLLAAGFVTPLAAAILIAVMIVASGSVHLPNGFFAQNGGYEYPLVLAFGALALAFTGPGAFSVDAAAGLALHGSAWGIGALLVGLVGGGLQLAGRLTKMPA